MSEPIHDGGKLNEVEEGAGEFAVTSADTARGFDAAEEVLNLVPALVVTTTEASWVPSAAFRREAAAGPLGAQSGAEDIGVKALLGHDSAVPHAGQHRDPGMPVVLLAGGETDREDAPEHLRPPRAWRSGRLWCGPSPARPDHLGDWLPADAILYGSSPGAVVPLRPHWSGS